VKPHNTHIQRFHIHATLENGKIHFSKWLEMSIEIGKIQNLLNKMYQTINSL